MGGETRYIRLRDKNSSTACRLEHMVEAQFWKHTLWNPPHETQDADFLYHLFWRSAGWWCSDTWHCTSVCTVFKEGNVSSWALLFHSCTTPWKQTVHRTDSAMQTPRGEGVWTLKSLHRNWSEARSHYVWCQSTAFVSCKRRLQSPVFTLLLKQLGKCDNEQSSWS